MNIISIVDWRRLVSTVEPGTRASAEAVEEFPNSKPEGATRSKTFLALIALLQSIQDAAVLKP